MPTESVGGWIFTVGYFELNTVVCGRASFIVDDPDITVVAEGFDSEPATSRIKRFTLECLTSDEKKDDSLWMAIYRGGIDAVVACRELVARSRTTPEVRVEHVYVDLSDGKRKLKYVVCDQLREHWLTPSGAGYMAADEAIVFDSEIEATKALSQYRRSCAVSDVKLLVKEIGV